MVEMKSKLVSGNIFTKPLRVKLLFSVSVNIEINLLKNKAKFFFESAFNFLQLTMIYSQEFGDYKLLSIKYNLRNHI